VLCDGFGAGVIAQVSLGFLGQTIGEFYYSMSLLFENDDMMIIIYGDIGDQL
jgi:hypothetical protein